jgi:hypothetical protein
MRRFFVIINVFINYQRNQLNISRSAGSGKLIIFYYESAELILFFSGGGDVLLIVVALYTIQN